MNKDITYSSQIMENFLKEINNMENNENNVTPPVVDNSTPLTWANPDEYKKATGKRFRLTKEEQASGLTRQQVFEARVRAGKLQ